MMEFLPFPLSPDLTPGLSPLCPLSASKVITFGRCG